MSDEHEASELPHLTRAGHAHMIDVGAKEETARSACAQATLRVAASTMKRLRTGTVPKGDVYATARIAAIMAAKSTPTLLPLCHPIALTGVEVTFEQEETCVRIRVTTRCRERTGVEMEAMTGASVAALAMYDMVKGLDRGAAIESVFLLRKEGGRSGSWARER